MSGAAALGRRGGARWRGARRGRAGRRCPGEEAGGSPVPGRGLATAVFPGPTTGEDEEDKGEIFSFFFCFTPAECVGTEDAAKRVFDLVRMREQTNKVRKALLKMD